ncbi:R1AB [Acrasis kona]|uniref:R1AB n=1 Tax=Acrasis kona TaxID=1008807 RepID=A0AAW2Z6R9_9EUKA
MTAHDEQTVTVSREAYNICRNSMNRIGCGMSDIQEEIARLSKSDNPYDEELLHTIQSLIRRIKDQDEKIKYYSSENNRIKNVISSIQRPQDVPILTVTAPTADDNYSRLTTKKILSTCKFTPQKPDSEQIGALKRHPLHINTNNRERRFTCCSTPLPKSSLYERTLVRRAHSVCSPLGSEFSY